MRPWKFSNPSAAWKRPKGNLIRISWNLSRPPPPSGRGWRIAPWSPHEERPGSSGRALLHDSDRGGRARGNRQGLSASFQGRESARRDGHERSTALCRTNACFARGGGRSGVRHQDSGGRGEQVDAATVENTGQDGVHAAGQGLRRRGPGGRRRGRHRRIRGGRLPPGDPLRSGAHDAPRPGGQRGGRQDGDRSQTREKPRGRVSPADSGGERHL